MWVQSKENIITPEKDNAGSAFRAESIRSTWIDLIKELSINNNIDLTKNTIAVYGEYVGKGIQKGVAISNLEKSVFVIGVKVAPFNEEEVSYWIDYTTINEPDHNIFNIDNYKTYEIEVDFNMPQLVQNEIIEMTMEVERECPVSKEFGFLGVGEGIVFSTEYKGVVYRFKSKGELHSVSRVKTLASVDTEKLNSIVEFIDYAVTRNRVDQAIEKTMPSGVDMKLMGDLMRWMINDIIKEESDTLVNNGLEPKDIGKYVSNKTREIFMSIYNSNF